MKNLLFIVSGVFFVLLAGCAMFTSWKAIPPPGGCDQCHTLPVGNNWTVAYRAPILSDERNREYFQTEKYSMPNTSKPSSSIEVRKLTDEKCFDCHKAPNIAHKGRMGRYHH
jgi:hypothetical protein